MTDTRAVYSYVAYGLKIVADFPCPELVASGDGSSDVSFRIGQIESGNRQPNRSALDSAVCQARRNECFLHINGIALYSISAGREIVLSPEASANMDAVRLFLFSTAMGALLHQRGALVLHGSAVATPEGAVVFVGSSGCGKSTLGAALYKRGLRVLADDICCVSTLGSSPVVLPASPYLMLWSDSVEELGLSSHDLRRVRPDLEKFRVPVAHNEGFSAEPVPLKAIYLLEATNSDEFELTPVRGLRKLEAISENTYRRSLVDRMELSDSHWQQVISVGAASRMIAVQRPRRASANDLADLLLWDFCP